MIRPEDLPCRLNRNYEVTNCLGRGSYGAVYKGRSLLPPRRDVAIKYLFGDNPVNAPNRKRILDEAKKFENFDHRNIVKLYAVDQDRDRDWFMVSQYVNGPDLQEKLRERRGRGKWIESTEAFQIIEDILAALEYIQKHGVIHRDIKPDNILLDEAEKKAMLADFGIAVPMENRQKTFFGPGTGPAHYQHPRAKAGEESFQTDLFSLGIVAYVLLTGAHPFADPALVIWPPWELLEADDWVPDPLCLRKPEIPKAVGEVIDQLVLRDEHAQFQNASEALEALRQAKAFVPCPQCKRESSPSAKYCFECGTCLIPK